jgi:hypothetical protein
VESVSELVREAADSKRGNESSTSAGAVDGAGVESTAVAAVAGVAVTEKKEKAASEVQSATVETPAVSKAEASAADPHGGHDMAAPAVKVSELKDDPKILQEAKEEKPSASATEKSETNAAGDIIESKAGKMTTPKTGVVVGAGAGSVAAASSGALAVSERKANEKASEVKSVAIETSSSQKDGGTAADPTGDHSKAALSDIFGVSKLGPLKQPSESSEPGQPMSSVTSVLDDGVASGSKGTIVVGSSPRSARSQDPAEPAFYEGLVEEFIEKALVGKPNSESGGRLESK